jgi:hypothetical protein
MYGMKMMMRRTVAAAGLLVGLVVWAPARADTPKSSDEARSWAQLRQMKPMDVMHMCDTDKKGYVTREEFAKFQEQLFASMDANHDGKVDEAEWMGKAGKK